MFGFFKSSEEKTIEQTKQFADEAVSLFCSFKEGIFSQEKTNRILPKEDGVRLPTEEIFWCDPFVLGILWGFSGAPAMLKFGQQAGTISATALVFAMALAKMAKREVCPEQFRPQILEIVKDKAFNGGGEDEAFDLAWHRSMRFVFFMAGISDYNEDNDLQDARNEFSSNKSKYEKLNDVLANSSMNKRQMIASIYFQRKILDEALKRF